MAKPSISQIAPGSNINHHCSGFMFAKLHVPITFCSMLSGQPKLNDVEDDKCAELLMLIEPKMKVTFQ